jgi:hypothetical protein
MDRHLEIAFVSGALAVAWAFIFRLRLREGYTRIKELTVLQQDKLGQFWTVMLFLGLIEAGFVGLAVVNFVAWLSPP